MEESSTISWKAFDRQEKERKVDWFWALAIVAITGAVLSFLFGNFLFGVFIVLATIILIFFITQKPQEISYEINNEGFVTNSKLIPYSLMAGFWIEEGEDMNKLLIETTQGLTPIIGALYEDKTLSQKIYSILIEHIEEKPLVEPISHQIFEKLGF